MLKISRESIFYIICPANHATGGPEDLHQLADELRNNNFEVYMHYLQHNKDQNEIPVHKEYTHFNLPYTEIIANNSQNIIIAPETFTTFLWSKKYKNLQKVIWWLSVTNYFISLKDISNYYENKKYFAIKKHIKNYPIPTIEKIKKSNFLSIAHSYFSLDFLKKNNFKIIGQIQDYMDDMFYLNEDIKSKKENIITYNGVKNGEFLEKIKEKAPDINWLPMQNMTLKEVADCMKRAKIYIDFGYHPGKEKMPREACLLDCCMIVGKDGSAKYKEDMPILDEYHFEKDEKYIPEIIEKIYDCLENYETRIKDFEDYKNFLLKEKETFRKDVKKIFSINNNGL